MIKRLLFRIFMMLAIVVGIMSYIASMNGIDIRQFVPTFERPHLPSFKLPTMPAIKLPTGDGDDVPPGGISKIYKWRGDDGSWHFSEQLPEGVTPEKTIFLNAETNIVQSLPQPEKTQEPIAAIDDQAANQPATQPINLNPYSQQAIEKLLNDARGVQAIMDQRNRELDQAIQSQ